MRAHSTVRALAYQCRYQDTSPGTETGHSPRASDQLLIILWKWGRETRDRQQDRMYAPKVKLENAYATSVSQKGLVYPRSILSQAVVQRLHDSGCRHEAVVSLVG